MADLEGAQLVARVVCEDCNGEGERASDDWEAYHDWEMRQPRRRPEDAFMDEAERVERYFLEVCGYDSVPPQREPCETCDGTGTVDSVVPVDALVELVLKQVHRPVIDQGELAGVVAQVKASITDAASASRGLADGHEMGSYLRAVQEGAAALRELGELDARRKL